MSRDSTPVSMNWLYVWVVSLLNSADVDQRARCGWTAHASAW
ncbi:hypothetical protein ACFQL4_20125 [Halosimplex aquaticum]